MKSNKSLEDSIAAALECDNTRLLKYMPYILQDFWDIGTSPQEVIKIIKKYKSDYSTLKVLDLGSGKGAVSINIASELKCNCFGIDGMEEFVKFSIDKAKEFSVTNICAFEKNDIRTRIKTLGKYDVIILGAIGPVLGNYYATLLQLTSLLNKSGIIIVDDAYTDDDCIKDYPNILRKSELIKQINNAGMELIDELVVHDEIPAIDDEYEKQFKDLQKRCMELVEKHPEDKEMFFDYVERQREEYNILSSEITPALLVITQKV